MEKGVIKGRNWGEREEPRSKGGNKGKDTIAVRKGKEKVAQHGHTNTRGGEERKYKSKKLSETEGGLSDRLKGIAEGKKDQDSYQRKVGGKNKRRTRKHSSEDNLTAPPLGGTECGGRCSKR